MVVSVVTHLGTLLGAPEHIVVYSEGRSNGYLTLSTTSVSEGDQKGPQKGVQKGSQNGHFWGTKLLISGSEEVPK